ncbi:hypothetical protein G6F31_021343 [Rhizopus arrhizus]|nr:hypothetical protein G6F31_021343 [Rhizopus arrhizus]
MGPGAIDPSVMTGLRADMLPDSLRHLSLHPSQNTYTWKGGAMPRLESLTVGAASGSARRHVGSRIAIAAEGTESVECAVRHVRVQSACGIAAGGAWRR